MSLTIDGYFAPDFHRDRQIPNIIPYPVQYDNKIGYKRTILIYRYEPSMVIVGFNSTKKEAEFYLKENNLEIDRTWNFTRPTYNLKVDKGEEIEIIGQLLKKDIVDYATLNYYRTYSFDPRESNNNFWKSLENIYYIILVAVIILIIILFVVLKKRK